ncbi:MAG TPA: hypothetical protein VK797_22065 [Tepidisphaeraceae bacterium]|jgi:hypothetical protein|nr:hypothetical protein [Tepidisphaeraceae bacterium]
MFGLPIHPLRLLVKLLLIVLIAIGHMRALYVLYPTESSELIRFVVPTVAALCLYLAVIFRKHVIFSLIFALVLAGLSLAGGLILAINTYGS